MKDAIVEAELVAAAAVWPFMERDEEAVDERAEADMERAADLKIWVAGDLIIVN